MGGPKTHLKNVNAAKPAAPAADKGKTRKFTPRAPAPVSERLPKLYRALTDQVNDGFFDNAKRTCKKILALDATSTSAFQTLLFLHLHTDDYAAALALVTAPPSPSTAGALDFERAYCLYRLHRETEALAALDKISERGRREQHLEAQVRYRLGQYEAAQALYDELLSSAPPASSEYDDIRTNQTATAAHLSFIQREYAAHLSAPPVEAAGLKGYTVPAGEIESYVPTIPAGWAPRGAVAAPKPSAAASASTSTSKTQEKKDQAAKKPRHKLPKGAVPGKPFAQDPDRWLPLRQRASFVPAAAKKKKEQTGLGTQGATGGGGGGGHGGGGNQGGGGGKKKGKKK